MVTLYVGGKPIGTWAEAERTFAEAVRTGVVEFRDADGRVIATATPPPEDPDWVKAITPEETARRMTGEFITTDELMKQLGGQ